MTPTIFHSEHHRRLNVLAGAWRTTITQLTADGSESDRTTASDVYSWMPSGQFLVHEVDAIMGGQRVQSTEIIGVDTAAGGFFSRSYDPDGSTHDFTSMIDGINYTINGKAQRFAGHFSEDGQSLKGEWEQLVGDEWTPFVRIELAKCS